MNILEKEAVEIDHWKTSMYESPDSFSLQAIIYKLAEARIFWLKLEKYKDIFQQSTSILELGAGQGWAGAIVKKLYPEKRVGVSDISPDAMTVVKQWEQFLHIELDKKIVCKSYDIPAEDEVYDLVFCYESAHHFVEHQKTLGEVYRVLKKGGYLIYLHEPACRRYLYRLAYWRVNKKRPSVPEDVLVYKEMIRFAREYGFSQANYFFDPTALNRGFIETIYYTVLQKIPFLQSVLPCTVDLIFRK